MQNAKCTMQNEECINAFPTIFIQPYCNIVGAFFERPQKRVDVGIDPYNPAPTLDRTRRDDSRIARGQVSSPVPTPQCVRFRYLGVTP